jgi:hypothetical protein
MIVVLGIVQVARPNNMKPNMLTPCYLGKKYSSMLGFILLGLATWTMPNTTTPGRKTQQYET